MGIHQKTVTPISITNFDFTGNEIKYNFIHLGSAISGSFQSSFSVTLNRGINRARIYLPIKSNFDSVSDASGTVVVAGRPGTITADSTNNELLIEVTNRGSKTSGRLVGSFCYIIK